MKFVPFLIPTALLIIMRVLGFEGVYGQDPFEYVRFADALHHFYLTGTDPGDFFGPYMYPFLGSILSCILSTALSLQLISLFSMVGIMALVKKIIQWHSPETSDKLITLYLVVAVSCSPYFVRSSILAMSDMLAAFFLLLAYFQFLQFGRKGLGKYLLFYGLALSAAIVTRYQTAFIGIPLSIWLVLKLMKTKHHWFYLIGSVLVSSLIFIPHFLIKSEEGLSFLHHPLFERWSILHLFQRGFTTNDGTSSFLVPNIMYILSPLGHLGYLSLGFPLFVFAFWKKLLHRVNWAILFFLVIPYLIFLGGIPFQTQRFFTIVFPLIVVFIWPWFKAASLEMKPLVRLLPILALCQMALFTYSFNKFSKQVLLEKEVKSFLETLPQDQVIYTFALDVSFGYYEVKQPVKNIFVEVFDEFESGAFVLVQPENLEFQWRTGNPGKNWELLKEEDLELKQRFRKGWELYVIN